METGKPSGSASAASGGGGGLTRQDTAASHNSTGQGDFDFSDQLFNQLDNYADYLPMDDVVAQMSGWQPQPGSTSRTNSLGMPRLPGRGPSDGSASAGGGSGGRGGVGGGGIVVGGGLTTAMDADVPLPAALQSLMSMSGDPSSTGTSEGPGGGYGGTGAECSEEYSSMADEFDEDEDGADGDGDGDGGKKNGSSSASGAADMLPRVGPGGVAVAVHSSSRGKKSKASAAASGSRGGSKSVGSGKGNARKKLRGGAAAAASVADVDDAGSGGGGGQEAMSEERQKERNREHARNTRLRKKAYIETLRHQLQELADAKGESTAGAQAAIARESERQQLKKQVVQTFLLYRARGELDRRRWQGILAKDFALKLPVTPYRYFPASDVQPDQARHVHGVDAVVRDTASFVVLLDSLARRHGCRVRVQFFAEAEYIIVGGDSLMCRWSMRTENAVDCGAQMELHLNGMLHAEFDPSDTKLSRLAVIFDVMGFMQQLRRCAGGPGRGFPVAPSTLQMAEEPTEEARIVFALQAPFRIRSINEAWLVDYGVTLRDCQNKCMVLERNPQCPTQPPVATSGGGGGGGGGGANPAAGDASMQAIHEAYEAIAKQLPHSLVVLYHTKTLGPVCARLRLFPLYAGGCVTHYMGGLETLQDQTFPLQTWPTVLSFR